jgi:dynein heavy chain
LIERQYYYTRLTLEEKFVKDTNYVCAMQPPGGSRPLIDPRFMSLFSTFNITFPSDDNLRHIYKSILDKQFVTFEEDIKEAIPKITEATL